MNPAAKPIVSFFMMCLPAFPAAVSSRQTFR